MSDFCGNDSDEGRARPDLLGQVMLKERKVSRLNSKHCIQRSCRFRRVDVSPITWKSGLIKQSFLTLIIDSSREFYYSMLHYIARSRRLAWAYILYTVACCHRYLFSCRSIEERKETQGRGIGSCNRLLNDHVSRNPRLLLRWLGLIVRFVLWACRGVGFASAQGLQP